MKFRLIKFTFLVVFFSTIVPSFAQVDTIFSYNTLSNDDFLSSYDYPVQIARITPDRPCTLKEFKIHLGGGIGNCKLHLYGHEGGHVIPSLSEDLIEPIKLLKTNDGDTTIDISLNESVKFNNDQFFIVLDQFDGDFGVKQDTSYTTDFCISGSGGSYAPTYLLSRALSKFTGNKFHMALDVILNYIPNEEALFKEVTNQVGLPEDYSNYTVAWADVNHDLWNDLLIGQHLFINKGGTFEKIQFHPEAASKKYLRRSAFIDMNNDSHYDIILFGGNNTWLYLNDGNGRFERQKLNIPSAGNMQAFSFADINQDSYLDLVVAQLWSNYPVPKPNYLLLNDGLLGFENITTRLYPTSDELFNFPLGIICSPGIRISKIPNKNRNRRSRATQFIDYDQDGDQDLYIANYYLETDEFYENDGKGFFTSIPAPKPLMQNDSTSNHGTGVAWYDFDNDGDFDVLVPQLAHPRNMLKYDHRGTVLYENRQGSLEDVTKGSGIEFEETHAGASFGDVNNDGLADLITTAYYGCRFVDLYLQDENHSFQLSTYKSGFSKMATSSDVDFVDFNNDGKLDVVFGKEGNLRLFENISKTNNNWIKLNLLCATYNHFGIGAVVKVYVGDQMYVQEMGSGSGQGMQSPSTLHFGLGAATMVDRVEVWYGDHLLTTQENLSVNRSYLLIEE